MLSPPAAVLLFGALGFVGLGLAYAIQPACMAALTDLTIASATARAGYVATYRGFQIGFGLFLLACALKSGWIEPGPVENGRQAHAPGLRCRPFFA